MMLLFNQIKKDMKDGFEYFQYGTSKYKGYDVETSLEEDSVVYFITSETKQVTVLIPRKDFYTMSYGALSSLVMNYIWFRMVDKLED